MDTPEINAGDLVMTDSKVFAEPIGVAGQVGIVVCKRRTDCQVLYLHLDRGAWLPSEVLTRVDVKPEQTGKILDLLHRIARHLDAEEIELDMKAGQPILYTVTHHAVTLEHLNALRDLIGPLWLSHELVPAGLSRIHSVLRFHSPTQPIP